MERICCLVGGTFSYELLECGKYMTEKERMDIMTEMGFKMNEAVERIGMILVLGLCGDNDAVKIFPEKMKMWNV